MKKMGLPRPVQRRTGSATNKEGGSPPQDGSTRRAPPPLKKKGPPPPQPHAQWTLDAHLIKQHPGPTTVQRRVRRQRQRRWRLVQTPQQQPPQHWLQVQLQPLALELELPHFSGASDPRPQSFEPPCYPSTLGKCDVSYLSEPPCYPSTLGRIV